MSASKPRYEPGLAQARIRQVARRLNLGVALSSLQGPVWGTAAAIALWRFAVQRWVPAAAAVLVVGGMATAWRTLRPRLVTARQAAVIADRRAGAGGLLLTGLEADIGAWHGHLDAVLERMTLPRVDARRPLALVLLGLAFAVVATWVPLPAPRLRTANAPASGRVEQIATLLGAVAKEVPIEPDVRSELERLRAASKQGTFDAADWEAADSLGSELERKAEEADKRLLKAQEAADRLAEALESGRTLERLDRERDELERALTDLGGGSAEGGDRSLRDGFEDANWRPSSDPARGNQVATGPSPVADSRARPTGETEPAAKEGPEQHDPRAAGQAARPQDGRLGKAPDPTPRAGRTGRDPLGAQAEEPPPGTPGDARPRAGKATRPELDELRRALAERRARLARSLEEGGAGPARSAQRSRKPRPKPSASAASRGAGTPAGGDSDLGAGDERGGAEASGTSRTTRIERVHQGPHASRAMQGAPEHGPAAPTPLVFGGSAEMDPTRLQRKALPEGNGGDGAELLGLVAADPARAEGAGHGAASGRSGASGERSPANRERAYLPRNRTLIQRYFDTPKASQP